MTTLRGLELNPIGETIGFLTFSNPIVVVSLLLRRRRLRPVYCLLQLAIPLGGIPVVGIGRTEIRLARVILRVPRGQTGLADRLKKRSPIMFTELVEVLDVGLLPQMTPVNVFLPGLFGVELHAAATLDGIDVTGRPLDELHPYQLVLAR